MDAIVPHRFFSWS